MKSDKRFILAFALTVAFLYTWFEFFVPKPAPVAKPAAETTQEKTEKESQNSAASPVATTNEIPAPNKPTAIAKTFVTQTNVVQTSWSNQSGSPISIELKKYREKAPKDSPKYKVVPVGPVKTSSYWIFEIGGKKYSDENLMYQTKQSSNQIQFIGNLSPEILLEKTFTWKDDSYVFLETVRIENLSGQTLPLIATKVLSGAKKEELKKKSFLMNFAPHSQTQAVARINDKVTRWPFDDFAEEEDQKGSIAWAGFDSQYFVFAVLPNKGQWEKIQLLEETKTQGLVGLVYPNWNLAGSQVFAVEHYAGPKDIGVLKNTSPTFEEAIDLGSWLGPIARPILYFLRKLHSFIPNYGVAIILLTILVRLLLFPFTQMQARSMKKMQQHKPQMDALKEKYGEDKERYSREIMLYMRTHKINPAGGCLLLLPQLPIFFALYRVLYNSIELRHEPFFGWIRDLSSYDPLFVMPVLLGVTMFFQQKLTPSPTADPAQQAMMKFMPILFSVFMVFLPAGLNLYIFVSTLWGVAQQYWIQRDTLGGESVVKNKTATQS